MLHLLVLTAIAHSRQVPPTTGRKIVFQQNFAKNHDLGPKNWVFDDGPVYNNEIEKYTKLEDHNAFINGGTLVIEARKKDGKVTSARLESKAAWVHPYVEVVAKVPKGKGTWPAIWMLNERLRNPKGHPVPWPNCGEIDIMENVGFDPLAMHYSLHSGKYNWQKDAKLQRTFIQNVNSVDVYHKWGMDLRHEQITFYCDDKPVYTVKNTEDTFDAWPFDDPFYLILNLAIGGFWGGQKGVDESIFPSKFLIRSVKIYQ